VRVAALYRYPVKGFTPEACETLSVLAGGRIAGDRALGIRFADSPGDGWSRKYEFVALVNTPGIARLQVRFDPQSQRLRIALRGQPLVDAELDDAGRKRIAQAIERYVLALEENPLSSHPERLPLRVVGDGVTPRYQDSADGFVTLHSRESLAAVADASGAPDLSERRFRSNIAIEGLEPWEEQSWVGRRIRIGALELEAVKPEGRCLATHANPRTGERDLQVMQTLLKVYAAKAPTFAIALTTSGSGTLRLGDAVSLIG
jgi:uncharacterized protein YcbX